LVIFHPFWTILGAFERWVLGFLKLASVLCHRSSEKVRKTKMCVDIACWNTDSLPPGIFHPQKTPWPNIYHICE
jgi:hypothetical protein